MPSWVSGLYLASGLVVLVTVAKITQAYVYRVPSVRYQKEKGIKTRKVGAGRKSRVAESNYDIDDGAVSRRGEHRPQQVYTDCLESPSQMTMEAIGIVSSPYKERFGTPRQANVTAGVLEGKAMQGELIFFKGRNFDAALEDLEGFEYVWVISFMHLNQGWNPKVKPPRGPRVKRGLFSTRSPHRPNSIALSAVRIVSVDPKALTVTVEGLDLLDGTPILDIKPYVPYCDAFPNAKMGWLDELSSINEVDYLRSKPPPFIK